MTPSSSCNSEIRYTNWIPSLNFSTTIQVNRLCFCDEIDKKYIVVRRIG